MNKLEVFNQARETLSKSYKLTLDLENQFKLIAYGWELNFKNTDEQNTVEAKSTDGKIESHIIFLDDPIFNFLSKNISAFIDRLN